MNDREIRNDRKLVVGINGRFRAHRARDRFLAARVPDPITEEQKAEAYTRLAREATRGETAGSSAGGEQPTFTTYAMTPDGARHVIVRLREPDEDPVSESCGDLLLIEHLALNTLRKAGIPAASTRIVDFGGQRFLEIERVDRIGDLGRRALFSWRHWMPNSSGKAQGAGQALHSSSLMVARFVEKPPRELTYYGPLEH